MQKKIIFFLPFPFSLFCFVSCFSQLEQRPPNFDTFYFLLLIYIFLLLNFFIHAMHEFSFTHASNLQILFPFDSILPHFCCIYPFIELHNKANNFKLNGLKFFPIIFYNENHIHTFNVKTLNTKKNIKTNRIISLKNVFSYSSKPL